MENDDAIRAAEIYVDVLVKAAADGKPFSVSDVFETLADPHEGLEEGKCLCLNVHSKQKSCILSEEELQANLLNGITHRCSADLGCVKPERRINIKEYLGYPAAIAWPGWSYEEYRRWKNKEKVARNTMSTRSQQDGTIRQARQRDKRDRKRYQAGAVKQAGQRSCLSRKRPRSTTSRKRPMSPGLKYDKFSNPFSKQNNEMEEWQQA